MWCLQFLFCYIWLFETVIFQRMHEKPTKFKKVFAIGKRNCTGRIVSTHLTGRFFVYSWQVLARTFGTRLGVFGFYLNISSRLDFAAESCGIGRLALFYEDSDYENDSCNDSI